MCPRCGGTAEVRTARELFDTMNTAQGQGLQRLAQQFGWPGAAGPAAAGPGSGPAPGAEQTPGAGPSSPGSAAGPGQYAGQPPRAGQYTGQPARPGQYTSPGPDLAPGQFHQVEFGQSQSGSEQEAAAGDGESTGQAPGAGQGAPQNQGAQPGQAPPPLYDPADRPDQGWGSGDYDHYNAEGQRRYTPRASDFLNPEKMADDIGGAVMGAALGFAGRAIGRRMKKALEERVVPAMQARAGQTQQQLAQQKIEQDAIVARYPELRGCMKDQVIFLDGGSRTVPVSELTQPVTLAQADAVVAQLR